MNALGSMLAEFQLKLDLRAVAPTGIEKIDRRAYLTARAKAESAESAIEIGRGLQHRQIAGLRNMGSCSIPTALSLGCKQNAEGKCTRRAIRSPESNWLATRLMYARWSALLVSEQIL